MRQLIFLLLFITLTQASELRFAHDYDAAVTQAKKEHKNILLLITIPTCKWCRKLEATTLQDKAVVARIEKGFIPVHVTRDVDVYPKHLQAKMVPMTYFLYPNGEPIMRGTMGYWNVEDYLSIMDDVDYKIKKHKRLQQ